jgi:predicted enzyme related to lactoylglutathione lyase
MQGEQTEQKLRFEGLTLTVENVTTSVEFHEGVLGLTVAYRAEPAFALIKTDGGGSIGLLSMDEARKEGAEDMAPAQRRAIHVELSVDNLDAAYQELREGSGEVDDEVGECVYRDLESVKPGSFPARGRGRERILGDLECVERRAAPVAGSASDPWSACQQRRDRRRRRW